MSIVRTLILLLCAVAVQSFAARTPLRTQHNPLNIIFILADDLGYGDLGCYGQKKIRTPNIDRLAAEGMRFSQCYAGTTVCAPSRCCLMTGLHSGHARIRGNDAYPLQPGDVTVADILHPSGYRTGLIGKWGLGLQGTAGAPSKHGFDDFLGFLSQTHAHQYYPTNIWRFDDVARAEGGSEIMYSLTANRSRPALYVHDLFTTAATNFVRVNQRQPFFLYLAYTIPHANNELGKQTGNGMEVPGDAPYSDETWPQPEKNKAAMITRMDRDIGKLMQFLKGYHLDTNTVVFFTSDNGAHKEGGVDPDFFQSSGPLRGIKRDLYEGGIRVPMIVRWPGRIEPGKVSDFPWAFWDFLPTAAEIAGAATRVPNGIDGQSVLPVLLGREQQPHEFFYWEFHERGSRQAVRMGDWKAVRLAQGQPIELYNLKADLGETNNIAAAHPDIVEKIEGYLKTARSESERWPLRAPPKPGERVKPAVPAEVN